MAWVNPPYDYSEYQDTTGNKIRHERLFIQKCTTKLVPGGILVAVIPQAQLADEALATILAGWYDRLRVFKFVGDDYNVFKQVFVIGVRKEKYRNPRDSAIEGIQYCGKVYEARLMDICERPAEVAPYVIPALTDEYEDVFSYTPMTHAARMHAISQISPVRRNLEYHKLHYLRPLGAPISPAIQEKTGHIAMELSSGDVGVVPIDIDDQPALIKGTLVKEVEQKVERNDDPDAETQKVTETEKIGHAHQPDQAHRRNPADLIGCRSGRDDDEVRAGHRQVPAGAQCADLRHEAVQVGMGLARQTGPGPQAAARAQRARPVRDAEAHRHRYFACVASVRPHHHELRNGDWEDDYVHCLNSRTAEQMARHPHVPRPHAREVEARTG